jgi:hypothetical protein
MNSFSVVAKILAALVVLAGLVLVFVMYGDKIKAFCKKLVGRCGFRSCMKDGSDFANDMDFDAEDMIAADQDFEV